MSPFFLCFFILCLHTLSIPRPLLLLIFLSLSLSLSTSLSHLFLSPSLPPHPSSEFFLFLHSFSSTFSSSPLALLLTHFLHYVSSHFCSLYSSSMSISLPNSSSFPLLFLFHTLFPISS